MRARPSWDDYLMGLARVVSLRSPDESTRHGTVLASAADHRVLSTGYNGFPRHLAHDHSIPSTRPEKYPWMIHSEVNALASASGPLGDAVAYVTGRSCFNCLLMLWQHGVRRVVQWDARGWSRDDEEEALKKDFLRRSGMEVELYTPDVSWLEGVHLGPNREGAG